MPNKYLKIIVEDYELQDFDLFVHVKRKKEEEQTKIVMLENFVPEDYNVMEKPTGWNVQDLVESRNDDYTPQDWLNSHSTSELHDMILSELFNKLIS